VLKGRRGLTREGTPPESTTKLIRELEIWGGGLAGAERSKGNIENKPEKCWGQNARVGHKKATLEIEGRVGKK